MRRAIAILITVVVLIGAPVALASGSTDTLDEQVNAQTAAADAAMVDEVEDMVDEAEEEPPVFDPGEFTEPGQVVSGSGEQDLVTYEVNGDEISNPQVTEGLDGELQELASDEVAQRDVWDLFARVSQAPYEDIIDSFVAFTDGPQNILAAVAADPATDFETWTVYIDVADLEDRAELLLTVAHEYGHIVTLATDQIAYLGTPADPGGVCAGVELVGEGCAQAGSYYEAYHPFWEPIEAEHAELDQIADEDEYYAAVDQFYQEHQDQFVTPYSATSQAEDMAEAYSYWVIADDPDFGGVAQQKIEFWEQFPELVAGREAAHEALGL